jgi:hypothetical protein
MADESKPISDECLAFAADCIQAIVDTTLREQYTEVVVLSVAIKALKQAHPKEAPVVDKLLAELRDSVDIKAQVDSKIGAISKMFQSLRGKDREQALQELVRQYERRNLEN